MLKGLIGKKIGMTQIFDENGSAHAVTIIEAGPCYVTQVRQPERDGYSAVQLGFQRGQPQTPDRRRAGAPQDQRAASPAVFARVPHQNPRGQCRGYRQSGRVCRRRTCRRDRHEQRQGICWCCKAVPLQGWSSHPWSVGSPAGDPAHTVLVPRQVAFIKVHADRVIWAMTASPLKT